MKDVDKAKIVPFRQSAIHKRKLMTTRQKSARTRIVTRSISRLRRESRRIIETFGTIANDWAICQIRDEYNQGANDIDVFPEDIKSWILYKFYSSQYSQYDLFESLETFDWENWEGKYASNMKINFEFGQKLSNGSVINRRGNVSLVDIKALAASIWAEFKSDEQHLHPRNDLGDLLYFRFLLSIDVSVFIEGYKDMNAIHKKCCNDDSLNTPAIKFMRDVVPWVTICIPWLIVRDWIRTGDGTKSSDSRLRYLDQGDTIRIWQQEGEGMSQVLRVPRSVPEYFGKAGIKMFYLAKENGFMSCEDYDNVMARLDGSFPLVRSVTSSRNNKDPNNINDGSSIPSSSFPNSELDPPYSGSNNIRATSASSSSRAVQQKALAEAVKLSESDWVRLKLLSIFNNQTFTASQWATLLRYKAGRKSKGSAHMWLRSMKEKGYTVLRVQQSKRGSKRGIKVQLTFRGIEIIEAIRTLSPS